MLKHVWLGNLLGMLVSIAILTAILNIFCLPTWAAMLIGMGLGMIGSLLGGLAAYALGRED